MPRGSKPGEHRGGRKKGTPNKLTAEVKAALHAAFGQLGGVKALVAWGKKSPGEFYKLWVKLLPTEITGKDGGPLQLVKVIDLSGGDG
jgi:hypothetical protein